MPGNHPAGNPDAMDDYLHTLRINPDTLPPPGLDAQTAAFLRQLVQAEKAPARLEPVQHARIWDNALRMAKTSAAQPRPGAGHIVRHHVRSGDSPMLVSTPIPAPRGVRLRVTGVLLPFAAAVLVVVLVTIISRFSPTGPNSGGGNIPPLGSAGDKMQRASATPEPSATFTATSTHIPATMPDPLALPTKVAPFDMATPSPFQPTVVPPGFTSTPVLVPPTVHVERAIRMNSATRDELSLEQPLVTYRLPVEEDGWVAVAVRPDDPALDLTLSYDVAQLEPRDGSANGGGGGGAGGSPMPLEEIGLLGFVRSGSVLSLTVGANNIDTLGRAYFTLNIYQQSLMPVRVAQPVQAVLGPGQQAAMFVVESSVNQLVDLNVESDGSADLYMNVLEISEDVEALGHIYGSPVNGCIQGQPLFCMDEDGGARLDPELTDVTLLEGKRYMVVVRARELNAETDFTLTIHPR